MLEKRKPARDKAFLRWVHERMVNSRCCLCMDAPWTQLHHFGANGGMGMKPSDYLVCRVCQQCHDRYGFKTGKFTANEDRAVIIAHMQQDALQILEAYVQYQKAMTPRPTLAEIRQAVAETDQIACTIEKFNEWWWADEPFRPRDPNAQRDWIIQWADSRAAALIDEYRGDDDGEK
jgi:hypothetical protein